MDTCERLLLISPTPREYRGEGRGEFTSPAMIDCEGQGSWPCWVGRLNLTVLER